MELVFELLKKPEQYPYHLLLLADETREAIDRYSFDSDVYQVNIEGEIVGVFCLYPLNSWQIELKNIAVAPAMQSQGLGGRILDYIKEIARFANYKEVIVGTDDGGIRQIQFYERNGFLKFDRRVDFFIDNYSDPIFEDGRQLKDMILLRYIL